MGHPDCQCIVHVFCHCWPGHWTCEYHHATFSSSSVFTFIFQAFQPANAIFAGIGVLLLVSIFICCLPTLFRQRSSQAAKDAGASQDKLIDIFNRIERFFHRLEIYTGISPTTAMTDMTIEIMVEVLTILAIATKEVKRGRFSELISCLSTFFN